MSRATLQEAKRDAISLLDRGVLFDFQNELKRRYGVHPHRVEFHYRGAVQRIRDAVYVGHTESTERFDELSGETDGETIWVLRGLTYEELVETLVHEALHDSCFIRRPTRAGNLRGLTEELEHDVMDPILLRIFLEECQ
tara:strand:+ start:344 stop:760 length:417 start_codon:yes stop_codon:yes gene_type:complete